MRIAYRFIKCFQLSEVSSRGECFRHILFAIEAFFLLGINANKVSNEEIAGNDCAGTHDHAASQPVYPKGSQTVTSPSPTSDQLRVNVAASFEVQA